MIGGFITGGADENRRSRANVHKRKNLPKFEEVHNETRGDRLARWKKFKKEQAATKEAPKAPQLSVSTSMPPPPSSGIANLDQSLSRSKRSLIKSKIDLSKKPFGYVENAAISHMKRKKGGMFVMAFSPGNGKPSDHASFDTSEDQETEPEDTVDESSSIRFEDLSTVASPATENDKDSEEVNNLQTQLKEAAERMAALEGMCKALEKSCDDKEDELATSKVKLTELDDALKSSKIAHDEVTRHESVIGTLKNELSNIKSRHEQNLQELEDTQNMFRSAQHSANIMEKAMSKLTTKVESNSLKQKELSIRLEKSDNDKLDLQRKLDLAQKQKASLLAQMKDTANKAEEGDEKDALLAAMTTERDHAEARMKEVAGEFQEIKAEYETMKAEFDQAKETVETQKKLLEGYIKSACLLEEKLGAANEKVDQFDDLSKRFDTCKAEGLKWKTESEGCQAKIQQMSEQMNSQLEASKEVQKMVQVMRSRTNQSVAQLKEEKDRAEKAEAELKAIKEMMSKKEMEFMQLNDSYAAACDENETLQKDLQKTRTNAESWRTQVTGALQECEKATANAKTWESQISYYHGKARSDETLRRKLHNQVMELKGNIRVYCRVRPFLENEKTGNKHKVFRFPDTNIEQRSITHVAEGGLKYDGVTRASNKPSKFVFDRVFTPREKQEEVYNEVGNMVQSAADGYRVCIFAYGQTGSGKTHTMHGPLHGDDRGIIPRAASHIFEYCEKLETQGWTFSVSVSMVEIYNEKLRDLLNPNSKASLEIHHHLKPADGEEADTVVDGLSEHTVTNAGEILKLLRKAGQIRQTAATHCNAQSSRSHTVFSMKINGFDSKEGKRRVGKLNLVDLAGSERLSQSGSAKDPKLLKEAQNINKSLSTLGNVISAVASQNGHVPFRDSKLTYLLQRSLGGDCKALMFCNLSPQTFSTGESLCSLRFAKKVNACERKYLYDK